MVRRLVALLATLLLAGALAPPGQARARAPHRPVIFVHGFSGSGGQFETQARRLTSNGYRGDLIEAHEYDSLFQENTREEVYAALDARIDRLLARSRADKVDLLAHSLGTVLMQEYLRSSPKRAAKVAHYVNLDGAPSADPPGGVPTLAVWGEGSPERRIGGARNVRLPDQAHTEVVTSKETFAEFFAFFTGRAPRTTEITAERGAIALSGRAVLFPSNLGAAGVRLEVYEVDPRTGRRRTRLPVAIRTTGRDGSWGPIPARPDAHYEFALVWSPTSVHHLYFQPFRRSDRLVRLLTGRPGEGLSGLMETGDRHVNLVISRQREWWGDQGAAGDSLRINGREVLNAANAPRAERVIGIFAFDAGVDRITDLSEPLQPFFGQPFMTGMDVYVPVGRPVTVTVRPRGGNGEVDTLTVPGLPSSGHRMSLQFDDHLG
ncbi:alpha/beta fold hydrolase [Thermomonospora catenispora]|uniref:alpha/beta fold hydrolase n=1 Tax=Thermomonospora catenispora TaxID=2493090 RepID=UPI0011232F65|nr:alpha/beta fold hydrolase [Thermomonospora catenispora]TNY35862.1 alpha/beta hydrolase [Thermomonospora catenispora]